MSLRDEGHASPQRYLYSVGLSDLSTSLFLANTIVHLSYDLEDYCAFVFSETAAQVCCKGLLCRFTGLLAFVTTKSYF